MSAVALEVDSGGPVDAPGGALFGEPIAAWRSRTRGELGIPSTGDIVAGAGHQAYLWHPGILAKFVQARRVAGANGVVVHLVVDHDTYDPAAVRVPVRRDGELGVVNHRFAPATGAATALRGGGAVAAMALPAFEPRPYDGPPPVLPSISEGLERARAALADAAAAPNAAMQTAAALSALMARWAGGTVIVADSALLSTTLGRAFVEAMRRDPRHCAESFNAALAADPRAARPLRLGGDPELPLWVLAPDGRRERVTASQLDAAAAGAAWLPRASLLSAIARLGIVDRFVHGTGAKRYERVTEAWIRRWLDIELPPIDIATASLRLPLAAELAGAGASRGAANPPSAAHGADGPRPPLPVTPQTLRRARWDPESLDAAAPAPPGPRKASLLAEIAALPRRSSARRAAYQRLLDELEQLRRDRAGALAQLEARAVADRRAAAALELAADRTWPFVYFDAASLDAAFAPSGSPGGVLSSSASGSGR